jgi:hypothetical protein
VIAAGYLNSYTIPSIAAVGGGVWSSGSLTVQDGTVFEWNGASGADGGFKEIPSSAMGGAIYVAGGGKATISNTTFTSNLASGGISQVEGGSGLGGAVYVATGQVTITTSTVTNNVAFAEYIPGIGGGGIYIASESTVYLDAFTVANTINNTADGPAANIDGTYLLT